MPTPQRLNTLPAHPIEGSRAYHEFLNRAKVRNPRAARTALQRILRVVSACKLDELTGVHIEHGISLLIADGYAKSYIDRSIRSLNAFCNWAMRNGYLTGNPCDTVSAPKDNSYVEPVVIGEPLLVKIQEYVLGELTVEDALLWAFLRAGCRVSEPCAVRKRDLTIDPASNTAWAVVGWKTRARKIKLPPWAYKFVVAWLTAQSAAPDDKLLLYLNGRPLDESKSEVEQRKQMETRTLIARTRLDAWQRTATGEAPTFSPKDMRSTFITKALRANPSKLVEIAKFVGNSPQVLTERYAHLLDQTDFSDQMG